MKPHEEEWVLSAEDPESGPVIGPKGGGVLFDCNDTARARLAHAAPDMARVLLANVREDGHTSDCDNGDGHRSMCSHICVKTCAALTKAGVPLP